MTMVANGAARQARAIMLALVIALCVLQAAPAANAKTRGGMSGTMKVNQGAPYTTLRSVTLNSSVSGATEMRVQDAGSSWSAWGPYAATRSWTLPAGDGQKTVTVQYRSSSGKSLARSDTIILDTTPPVTTATVTTALAQYVAIDLLPSDAVSGVAATLFRFDGGAWRTGMSLSMWGGHGHRRPLLLPGSHAVEFYSLDVAGNAETLQSLTVTL